MGDEELKNLSPEEQAMRMALSVLGGSSEFKHDARPGHDPDRGDGSGEASAARAAEIHEPAPDLARRIASRSEIPVAERYVLVMWGLSTYRFDHEMGVTFVVDNSVRNRDAEREFREALGEARKTAERRGLPFFYVLD
jgi:hypothetical protein